MPWLDGPASGQIPTTGRPWSGRIYIVASLFPSFANTTITIRYNSDNKYQNCAVMREEGEWTSEPCDWFDGDSDEGEEWKERGRREKRTDFGVGVVAVLVALQF